MQLVLARREGGLCPTSAEAVRERVNSGGSESHVRIAGRSLMLGGRRWTPTVPNNESRSVGIRRQVKVPERVFAEETARGHRFVAGRVA